MTFRDHRLLSAMLLLLAASLVPASSATTAAGPPVEAAPAGLDEDDDTALFVLGNTLFAVYHELGHALVDLLDLPVVGREEDAVDGFAAIMMIAPAPDPTRDELIIAVADGWRLQSAAADLLADRSAFWNEHALDEQRHYAVVCLMVGSDQSGFFDFALDAGLPVERIRTCTDDFERMAAGWRRLLESHRKEAGTSTGRMRLVFEEAAHRHREAFALVSQGSVVQRAISELDAMIALPETITVRFADCPEANARWYPDRREVSVCYALADEFLAILAGSGAR